MIIITGASQGIGKYIFNYYNNKNIDIIGIFNTTIPTDHNEKYYKLDILNLKHVEELISHNKLILNNIVLINCAGINYNSFAHKSDPDKWKNVIDTNLYGTYNMIRSFLPLMREQKFGRIINFSSVVALNPTPGVSAYAASKSALWGLSKSLAIENAAFNITINNINLGYSTLGMIKEVPKDYLEVLIKKIPANRLCDSESITNSIDFLMNTSYINGSSIDVSGGLV